MVEEKKYGGDHERPQQLSKVTSSWLDSLIGKIPELASADLPKIELLELMPLNWRPPDPDAVWNNGKSGKVLVARATGGDLASPEVLVELSTVHRFMRGDMREAESYRDLGFNTGGLDGLNLHGSDSKEVNFEPQSEGMSSLDDSERIRKYFAQDLGQKSESLEARMSEPIASSENETEETLKPVAHAPIIRARGEEIKKGYYENALKKTLERLYRSTPPD